MEQAKNYTVDTTGMSYDDACKACRPMIEEAMKFLSTEPAAMLYLSICEMAPINDKEVTLRLFNNSSSGISLQYNPYFICQLSDPSILAFILYSEAMRIALHHCTSRIGNPISAHKIASDLIVSEDRHLLSSWRETVRKIMDDIPKYQDIADKVEPLGFDKNSMWQLEKIRDYLRQAMEQERQEQQGGQGEGADGQESGKEDEGEGNSEGQSTGDSKKKKKSSGKGNGKDKSGDASSDGESAGDPCRDALKQHYSHSEEATKKATEGWGENTMADGEIRRISDHIASNPEMWGSVPGQLQELIRRANAPKFDPTRIIKHWKQTIISEEMYDTRSKRNRRHGFERPGWRHNLKASMVECIDASGSMSDEDVALGESFVNLFIKHCETSYCFWDCSCGPITKVKSKQKCKNIDVVGRGGTDPSCIIEKLEEEKLDFGGILVFTDNGFDWKRPKQKYINKIFIIGTEGACEPPEWCRHYLNMKEIKKWMKER